MLLIRVLLINDTACILQNSHLLVSLRSGIKKLASFIAQISASFHQSTPFRAMAQHLALTKAPATLDAAFSLGLLIVIKFVWQKHHRRSDVVTCVVAMTGNADKVMYLKIRMVTNHSMLPSLSLCQSFHFEVI